MKMFDIVFLGRFNLTQISFNYTGNITKLNKTFFFLCPFYTLSSCYWEKLDKI